MWDFTNLPDSEWSKIRKLLDERNFVELVKIHNEYKLSEYSYCCGGEINSVIKWFEHGFRSRKQD